MPGLVALLLSRIRSMDIAKPARRLGNVKTDHRGLPRQGVGQIGLRMPRRVCRCAADQRLKRARGKTHFASSINAIRAQPHPCTKNSLSFYRKLMFPDVIPPHRTGAYASSRYVECGQRWTRHGRETNGREADGEVVWSWSPGAETKFKMLLTSIASDRGKQAGP
jgi:hypothetical protein